MFPSSKGCSEVDMGYEGGDGVWRGVEICCEIDVDACNDYTLGLIGYSNAFCNQIGIHLSDFGVFLPTRIQPA
jgi:hypothetical protein